ncbi:MAG: DUF3090 family protein [Actinomycetota bacterium]|nr:MAG: DUF3090 family protein [Actinomycetota bacterium]
MARRVLAFDPPERFVAGTVGQPGERTFFLQARRGRAVTSVTLEKAQAAALAERIDELLDEVLRRSAGEADIPVAGTAEALDTDPLESPIVAEFRIGAMALGWDPADERLVIEAHATVDDEDVEVPELGSDDPDGPDCLRVRITGAQARAFARRTAALVAAGRPPCPFCHQPLDPAGHICPRANGYRR